MAEIRFGSPLPVHVPFHQSTAFERAAVGAFGSGKSYALVDDAIARGLEQPGCRIVISRWTIPNLRDTTEAVFFDRLPQELYKVGQLRRSGGHAESFTLPNGTKFMFRGLDDWKKHRSMNVAWWYVDEADEIDEETWDGITSRVRQRDPTAEAKRLGYTAQITRRGKVLCCNPAGHNWIFRRFVDPSTRKANTEYFRSTSFDNPYLPKDTLDEYLSYPEQWIRRYVLCQFDDFAGQIYPEWGWDTHVVPSYMLPKDGLIWMGFDIGTRNPNAGLWVHVDNRGPATKLVGVAEWEQAGSPVTENVKAWRRIERQLPAVRWRVADPNINTRDRGTTHSLHDQYRHEGYNFQLGPRTHKDRIPMLGNLIATGRFVVTEKCPLTYEAIKQYRWEDLSPAARKKGADAPEKPVKSNDHLVDCAQYVSSRWAGRPMEHAPTEQPKSQWRQFSEDMHALSRRRRAQRVSYGVTDVGAI